jgi:hypothetical protein
VLSLDIPSQIHGAQAEEKENLKCGIFSSSQRHKRLPLESDVDLTPFKNGSFCFQHPLVSSGASSFLLNVVWKNVTLYDMVEINAADIPQEKMRVTVFSNQLGGKISLEMDQIQFTGHDLPCDVTYSNPDIPQKYPLDVHLTPSSGEEKGAPPQKSKLEMSGPNASSCNFSSSLLGRHTFSFLVDGVEVACFPVQIIGPNLGGSVEVVGGSLYSYQPGTLKIRFWDLVTNFDVTRFTSMTSVSIEKVDTSALTYGGLRDSEGGPPSLHLTFTPYEARYTVVLSSKKGEGEGGAIHTKDIQVKDPSQFLGGTVHTLAEASVGRPHRIQSRLTNLCTSLPVTAISDIRVLFSLEGEQPIEAVEVSGREAQHDSFCFEFVPTKTGEGSVDLLWKMNILERKILRVDHNVEDLSCEVYFLFLLNLKLILLRFKLFKCCYKLKTSVFSVYLSVAGIA